MLENKGVSVRDFFTRNITPMSVNQYYILGLQQSDSLVSVETVEIMKALPRIEFIL